MMFLFFPLNYFLQDYYISQVPGAAGCSVLGLKLTYYPLGKTVSFRGEKGHGRNTSLR